MKVQLVLHPDGEPPHALFYDQLRALHLERAPPVELAAMMGEDQEAFFWCRVETGNIVFYERAPEQDW